MWFLKMIGWLVFGFFGLVVLAAYFDEEKSSDQLEVQIKPDPLFGAFPTLSIKNVGKESITIVDLTANNRPECAPEFPGPNGTRTYVVLKVGESGVAVSKCEIVRTKIKTDKGSFEYTFRERH